MVNIILFDGECHFCDQSVQFIIKRDLRKQFKFASIQGEIGQKLLQQHGVPTTLDSIVLIEDGKIYTKSSAVLRICKKLDRLWKLFYVFIIVPTPIRNVIYDLFAKNRHKLNKSNQCRIPSKDDLERFL
ncbi:thiol-disulfide oxidoreductase DCC family protein [Ureibacillus sp. NPDC094379]